MALPKQKEREIIFQLLFCYGLENCSEEEQLSFVMSQFLISKKNVKIALEAKKQIEPYLSEIDQLIKDSCKEYSLERIPLVERAILRLGIYEIVYDSSIPPKVAISEGMRLAKKFSTKESVSFINAVLDQVYQTNGKELCPL